MRIFAYTQHYAQKTTTFMTNELKELDNAHELLLAYSVRLHPTLYNLKHMVQISYYFNKVSNKLRWWLEQSQLYYSLYNFNFSRNLNAQISQFKPEVIHCHFGTDFLRVFSNLEEKHRSIPFLISFYGFDVTEKIRNKAILKKYRNFLSLQNVHSVAVSGSLAKNINEVIKPANKAIVLHSGTNTNFFKRFEHQREPGVYTFLQVSSFLQKKGHRHTLQAFRQFIDHDKRYNYKFILAGLGPLQEEILNYIKELGLQDNVSFVGTVSPAEMVEVGSRADCFVQMSITADNGDQEGLPNVLLEAMSLELPILSTKHAGIPEIVIDGINGILCEEKNIEQYVKAFTQIVSWPKLPQNRERIVAHFSLASHMRELENIYKRISN